MKKALALTLAVVLILSALPLTVFAKTAEGTYNGYYYTANLTVTTSAATTKMTYAGTAKIKSNGTLFYVNGFGNSLTTDFGAVLKQSVTTFTQNAPNGGTITKAVQSYYVTSTKVDYITETAS